MRTSILATVASVALVATACPISSDGPSDTQILNFALTLEHLENAFYTGGLNKYDNAAFEQAGFPSWVRKRFLQISEHEAAHVSLLQDALGDQAVEPCQYNFPYSDPRSFVALSMVLENVGVSAYLGAAKLISDPNYLTTAASIMTTEARHSAWVSSAVRKQAAWSGSLDTALDANQVYSIAASFMSNCPSSNEALAVQALPPLTVESCSYSPGSTIDLGYDAANSAPDSGVSNIASYDDGSDDSSNCGNGHYLAIYAGLDPVFVNVCIGPLSVQAVLPVDLSGMAFGLITTTNDPNSLNDQSILAGPAILYIGDNDSLL